MLHRCKDVTAKVSDILDREASLSVRLGFYGHVMICAKCRRYFAQFKRVKEAAGEIAADDAPVDFEPVMNTVMKEVEEQDKRKNA